MLKSIFQSSQMNHSIMASSVSQDNINRVVSFVTEQNGDKQLNFLERFKVLDMIAIGPTFKIYRVQSNATGSFFALRVIQKPKKKMA